MKTPIARMPSACVAKLASPLLSGTASVPQMPQNRCAGIAPTTSSTLSRSSSGTPSTTIAPPTAPISTASPGDGISGSAVIETSPAIAPLSDEGQVDLLVQDLAQHHRGEHAAGGREVGVDVDLGDRVDVGAAAHRELRAAVEAEPAEPQDEVPIVASGSDEPSIGLTAPPGPYLPLRAPSSSAPASAAQPPTEWTRVEPAKSEKPSSLSQPPPHCQAPVIG